MGLRATPTPLQNGPSSAFHSKVTLANTINSPRQC